MWITYGWAPYLISVVTPILQILLLIRYIWWPSAPDPSDNDYLWKNVLYQLFRGIFRYLYFFVGVLLLDISIFWLLGQWTYADWRFQLPSVILGLLVGGNYCIRILFEKPKVPVLLFALAIIAGQLYFYHWYLPSFELFRPHLSELTWLLIGGLAISLLYGIVKEKSKKPDIPVAIADHKSQHHVIIWDIILTIYALCQGILIFAQRSIFLW
jgi:hypothetical protein